MIIERGRSRCSDQCSARPAAADGGLGTRALIASPITGPEGNREFLVDLVLGPSRAEIAERIAEVTAG